MLEQIRKLATALKQIRSSDSINAISQTLDSLFGFCMAIRDPEALLELIHTIEEEIDMDGQAPEDPQPNIRERIHAITIEPSFAALNLFPGISFVERLGYLKPGAYKRAVHIELGIPLADLYDEPHLPMGAVSGAGVTARGMSKSMATTTKLSSAGPTSKKDGTPKMPLVDNNRLKRPDASGAKAKTKAAAAAVMAEAPVMEEVVEDADGDAHTQENRSVSSSVARPHAAVAAAAAAYTEEQERSLSVASIASRVSTNSFQPGLLP